MNHGHAVVIGGSIGGMCAAQALAPFFERVTVIERDSYPGEVTDRPGVPQSRHVHVLLESGRRGLERLFPGFTERMLARGAHDSDFGADFAVLRPTGWQSRNRCPVHALLASRSLTECTVRELLRATPKIEWLEHTEVTGLKLAGERQHVTAVSTRAVDGAAGQIEADLVVDASGRASKAPEWVQAVGAVVPAEEAVNSFSGYCSRWYQAPPAERWPSDWWWRGIWLEPAPPNHLLGGVLIPVEGGRFIVTLIGYSKQYPPTDEQGFTAALRSLRSPAIAEAVALATPLSPVYGNRALENRFRRYDRLASPLGAFVALGDSACRFNPVYGQGMSTTVICAETLASCVREANAGLGSDFARGFFVAQARALADPWGMATGADFSFPGTAGKEPPGRALFKRYTDVLIDISRHDPTVLAQVSEVFHLLKPATSLFALPLLTRVARRSLAQLMARGDLKPPIPPMPPVDE